MRAMNFGSPASSCSKQLKLVVKCALRQAEVLWGDQGTCLRCCAQLLERLQVGSWSPGTSRKCRWEALPSTTGERSSAGRQKPLRAPALPEPAVEAS